jgi:hypothetical protein
MLMYGIYLLIYADIICMKHVLMYADMIYVIESYGLYIFYFISFIILWFSII